MEMVLSARRRKRILLLAAAAGVGGYASYKVYKSSFVTRKRRRVASLIDSFVQMIEVFAMGIDSTSLLAGDLRNFLLSDDDEVPRSLKQGLKIANCREFQDALTAFSSCVSRGLVRSVADAGSDEFSVSRRRNGRQSHEKGSRSRDGNAKFQNGGEECDSSMECSSLKQEDRLPERVLHKIFSDPGKGFASAVLGSVARNTILSILEGLQIQHNRSNWDSRGLAPDVCPPEQGLEQPFPFEASDTLLDLCSSNRGRSFVAACIEAFVGTAVTVFLEKTKDVNFYEEVVAGVTKPSHQAAVKDLFSSVCSSAVETFVRTSHEVLSSSPPTGEAGAQEHLKKEVVKELVKTVDCFNDGLGAASESDSLAASEKTCKTAAPSSLEELEGQANMILVTSSRGSSRINVLPNWVDGISRTLAVPSNRKLLIDVAGTVTSEAIHSFFDVFLGVLSPYLRGNLQLRGLTRRERDARSYNLAEVVEDHGGRENPSGGITRKPGRLARFWAWVSEACKDVAGRILVMLTLSSAMAMHVLFDVPALEA
ncbi:protein PHLOEM PROTEIN 2-LIKE A10 [Selaginella moellendorffii]|nr:protein PHLOEM PROTEIN 2-LIKE A10 [Selaginella moellendorffii]|eukprot:XP_002965816.2 protein PHLOEM PROTEIN 2-LIKE A10 [Selaginella moellendorffii]